MSKNLIYANADEFHVKSTLVYAAGKDELVLYWDSEHTKPIYSDELERLYLAGGLKVDFGVDSTTIFLSPIVFNRTEEEARVICLAGDGTKLVLVAPARSTSSGNALFPAETAQDHP